MPGNVPDMKAQSDVYIHLQNIYKAKARRDADEVLEMVQATPGGRDVDPAEVELFCKNAAFVKLINASGGAEGGDGGLYGSADRLATVTGKFAFSFRGGRGGRYLACFFREASAVSDHLHSATSLIPLTRDMVHDRGGRN